VLPDGKREPINADGKFNLSGNNEDFEFCASHISHQIFFVELTVLEDKGSDRITPLPSLP
jgi:hypothetical protein